MSVALWLLQNNTVSGETIIQKVEKQGTVFTLFDAVALPEPLTHNGAAGDVGSTAAICSLPSNRNIVYIAGRSDATGEMVAWRYDDENPGFTELMREAPATGTWPWAVGLYAFQSVDEYVGLAVGNGSAWGVFANQNAEHPQGLWISDAGAPFVGAFPTHKYAYSGSNINHPNSTTDIKSLEGTPAVWYFSHTPTVRNPFGPNTTPNYAIIDTYTEGDPLALDVPHTTGLQFVGGWAGALSPRNTDPSDATNVFVVVNGNSTGPHAFASLGFGTDVDVNTHGSFSTGIGAYHSNSRCLVFNDNTTRLVSFYDDSGTIEVFSPIAGAVITTVFDTVYGQFQATCVGLSDTGGAAYGITTQKFGSSHVLVSEDYGGAFVGYEIPDVIGMAIAFGPEVPPAAQRVWPQAYVWADSRGFVGLTRIFVGGTSQADARGNAIAILALLLPLSNAAFLGAIGAWTSSPGIFSRGATLQYENIESRLKIAFLSEVNTILEVDIPCPKVDLLLENQESLDILQTDLADAVSGILGLKLVTRGGMEAIQWVGGGRYERPRRRIQTIRTLNPLETGPSGG